MRHALAALLLAAALLGCAKHPLENGRYQLQPQAIVKDPCSLAPPGGGLWDGTLTVSGDTVNFAFELNNQRLVGFYKAQVLGEPDEFSVDGTGSQVEATLFDAQQAAHSCPANTLQVHLDAAVIDDTHFHGQLRVEYDLAPDAPDEAVCGRVLTCTLIVSYQAQRVGS